MNPANWRVEMQHLKEARLLDRVDEPCLRLLQEVFESCTAAPGEVLLSPHEHNHYLYLVLGGELAVHLDSLEGSPVRLIGPGECAGEISFMDDLPPSAYVLALEDTVLLRVHRRSMQLLTRSPQLMQNLAELLCQRVRLSDRLIINSEQNANIDKLTGSFNRRWLEHIYGRESARCALGGQPLSLLMLDVDRFKEYNDRHGHLAGDHALCLVVNTLGKLLRPADSLVRYGGEEFVVLLPEMTFGDAQNTAERLRRSLAEINSFHSPIGLLPGVTISIGVAPMRLNDDLDSLINVADRALYRAKEQGRNRVCA
ncbi:GGDEF domain-containing protein [Pseudomonas stutzeri]|uniref:GGDEF domain-containing protein n=1 Tax=Stutzerimonas stutzeri TaxID=316 RepID=UPI000C9CAFBC|nr:GGDEF domain-containing protein [Stutzerimonas stutzeri]MCQ4277659.1 GGDEF domain-containing protein [Stutzerimonas stutzeri]PNF73469.1 GGDEF domain-containing protein [Stutzerimonas stutzeri]